MKRLLLVILIVSGVFAGCEKDDICAAGTPTTPRLVIEFYKLSTGELVNVKNLKVIGTGEPEGIIFNPDETTEAKKYLFNGNKISLPLRTLEDNTEYALIYDFGNSEPSNTFTDTLDFNYSREDVYVSRACGFKTLFTLAPDGNGSEPVVINNDPSLQKGNWIQSIEVLRSNIETENETHIKIFLL